MQPTPAPLGRSEAVLAGIVATLFALLFWATVLNGLRGVDAIRDVLRTVPASDKIGHFFIYGAITFFAALLAKRPRRIYAVGATVMLVGFLDEVRQIGEFGRAYSLGDLVANGLGILAAVFLAKAILRRMEPSQPEHMAPRKDPTPTLR